MNPNGKRRKGVPKRSKYWDVRTRGVKSEAGLRKKLGPKKNTIQRKLRHVSKHIKLLNKKNKLLLNDRFDPETRKTLANNDDLRITIWNVDGKLNVFSPERHTISDTIHKILKPHIALIQETIGMKGGYMR